tara:strand:- start:167 stop:805 length:639 start_codon:yes stop_codon:yes gene_type:complete
LKPPAVGFPSPYSYSLKYLIYHKAKKQLFYIVADSSPKSALFAGDSSSWTSTFNDYPASGGWVATCIFQRPGSEPLRLEATASGVDHVFRLETEHSASLVPGRWTWAIRVLKDTEAVTVQIGETVVRPNPEETPEETHAEKCLRLLQIATEERFVDVQESISLLGQDINKIPALELLQLTDRYQAKVNNERRQKHRLISGLRRRRGRIILTG